MGRSPRRRLFRVRPGSSSRRRVRIESPTGRWSCGQGRAGPGHVTLEAFERQSKQQDAAYREQHAQLQRAITILEAHNKVLWGVWQEHDTSGHHVPLAAVLARQELERKVAMQEFD
jgi:hypothetical protein